MTLFAASEPTNMASAADGPQQAPLTAKAETTEYNV